MNVYAQTHISLFGHCQSIGHLKSVTGSAAECGHEQIGIGKTVAGTPLECLLVAEILVLRLLKRIALGSHIHTLEPAQRNAHQSAAVGE